MKRAQERFRTALLERRVAEARLRNRDPGPAARLRSANADLAAKLAEAEEQLFRQLAGDGRSTSRECDRIRVEFLRTRTLEFMKTLKVDPAIWQDLASS